MLDDGLMVKHHPSSNKKGINQIVPHEYQISNDDIRRKQEIRDEFEGYDY